VVNLEVSPLTNTIYAGKIKPLANGKGRQWVGKKQDVTDEAISVVFEHMYNAAKETGGVYTIEIAGFGELTMVRKDKEK
jgi:nucleoid DNA-binding protein